MIKRALLVGALLAGLSGAAVFYGLGDAGNASSSGDVTSDVAVPDVAETDTPASEISEAPENPLKNPDENLGRNLAESSADDTSIDDSADATEAESKTKIVPEDALDVAVNTTSSARAKVKEMMKPRATGSFIVKDDTQTDAPAKESASSPTDLAQNSVVETPIVKTPAIETAQVDLSDAEIQTIEKNLEKALSISDKTERDKFYLEIFDNAIDSGNVDLAARVGEKLSTPELRDLSRKIISNSGK